ncbi:MAG: acyl carrier protein [Litorimonas sp.]
MFSEKALYADNMDAEGALVDIQRAFDIIIPHEDLPHIKNVGQLYDYVIDMLPKACGKKCVSSMTFYRLRQNIKFIDPDVKLKPTTQLQNISSDTPKIFWKKLKQTSSLNLPSLEYSLPGMAALYIGLLSMCALVVILFIKPTMNITFGLAFITLFAIVRVKSDPKRFPKALVNMKDLANEVVTLSHGKLLQEGARLDKNDHWNILTLNLALWSDRVEKEQIKRSTPFY